MTWHRRLKFAACKVVKASRSTATQTGSGQSQAATRGQAPTPAASQTSHLSKQPLRWPARLLIRFIQAF